jgi:hypothetical protein
MKFQNSRFLLNVYINYYFINASMVCTSHFSKSMWHNEL